MTIATVKVSRTGTDVRLEVSGELDLANAVDVEGEILAAIDNSATSVVVDLTDLRYIDSSGLRILFLLANRLAVLQIDMEVVAPHGTPTRRVIEMSGLDSLTTVSP